MPSSSSILWTCLLHGMRRCVNLPTPTSRTQTLYLLPVPHRRSDEMLSSLPASRCYCLRACGMHSHPLLLTWQSAFRLLQGRCLRLVIDCYFFPLRLYLVFK